MGIFEAGEKQESKELKFVSEFLKIKYTSGTIKK